MSSPQLLPSGIGREWFRRVALLTMMSAAGFVLAGHSTLKAQEGAIVPHWIWHPGDNPQAETRYFRRTFNNKEAGSKLSLDVTADNTFTLYLDGKEVAKGSDWKTAQHFEAKLPSGDHVLAAVATNEAPGAAGFLLRGSVQPLGQGAAIQTGRAWKTTDRAPQGDAWTKPGFDESGWVSARDLGAVGVAPWGDIAFESGDTSGRFKVPKGFSVAMIAGPTVTGSAVSFNFDPQGRPCVGIEQGPIVRLIDEDGDGKYDGRKVIAPTMKNCQGFSFIRGFLYAVGDGPQKTGIYRLKDGDNDGVFESAELIRATDGGMGEHGPHAVMLGPDGSLYYNNGNHAHLKGPISPNSPSNIAYEGEVLPHYNDSRGHAAGIMAPCGEIYRSDDEGKTWSRITSGFRNQYDFAINRDGEVFSFDSDMEWDIGAPWYRPVRVLHCPPGAELGSRNGSAAWPTYFYDSLPSTLDVGRGSPTGVTFYQGHAFPHEYDDNFLVCDWSQGRILAIEMTRDGATYKAKEKELVTGQPLNCTDIEVGPDGAVYFTTGGRGTLGGLYRVSWDDAKPWPKPETLIDEALEIVSPLSSFSQERLKQIQKVGGETMWGAALERVVRDAKATPFHRRRALELLTQFGPAPGEVLLIALSQDREPLVRAKAVELLGKRPSKLARGAIVAAFGDKDPFVLRRACEALTRGDAEAPVAELVPLLSHSDRYVRFAARVAIEHGDPLRHRELILEAKSTRGELEGMMALVRTAKLDDATQDKLLARQASLLKEEKLSHEERLDLLRLIGLTYTVGPRKPKDTPVAAEFRQGLLARFPDRDRTMNWELARLLAYFDEPKAISVILGLQRSESDRPTQIHYSYCLRAIKRGWNGEEKRQIWDWFETASHWDGGYSYLGYLDFMIADLLPQFSAEDRRDLLADGARTPFPIRIIVRGLDLKAEPSRIKDLVALYGSLDKAKNPGAVNELRGLILEKLGQAEGGDAKSALRELAKADPDRRDLIARALASRPDGDDLPFLIAALESRDPNTTGVVINALHKIDRKPEGPEALRNLIRLARRAGPTSQKDLNSLGMKWVKDLSLPGLGFDGTLRFWEGVYESKFPKGPALADGSTSGRHTYDYQELLTKVVRSDLMKNGSAENGRKVLFKARCLDCHKMGDQGQGVGPDLTTINSRFRPFEVLESIVEPSKVISDQYKSATIATTDGKIYNGMPSGVEAGKVVLLLSDGTKATINKSDIEEQKESKTSVMPEGLLDPLTFQEIADLLTLFNSQPKVEVKK